ncbi:hypothetical protein Avbf_17177 [Armadillidium vulgare]|nr:hypothetical protein Avbf_17177 [Armadillidium vulgare]
MLTMTQYFPTSQLLLQTTVELFTNTTKIRSDEPTDQCERDEVLMDDGTCQNLLTPGNCNALEEEVIMHPETNRGVCIRRICPPDRVFVAATQLCHDPKDSFAGRELYRSAFGTAVCTCPDGTIEGADDLDKDVCEPLLGKSLKCLPDQTN